LIGTYGVAKINGGFGFLIVIGVLCAFAVMMILFRVIYGG